MHATARVVLVLVSALGLACSQGAGNTGGTSDPSRSGTYAEHAAARDEVAFTQRFVAELAQRLPEAGCAYGGPRTVDCRDARISLDRMWGYCLDSGGDCDPVVEDFASGMVEALRESLGAATVTRDQLRLAIRTSAYGEQVARLTDGPIIRPVAGELVAIVMVDSPRTARGFGAADAEALGLPADAVYAVALENTLAELTPLPGAVPPACGSVMALENGYYYESTRLLDPRLAGGATTTTAPVLVALPTYDTVLIAQDCGGEARLALAAIAGEVGLASSAPLSGTLFRVTVDGITALTL